MHSSPEDGALSDYENVRAKGGHPLDAELIYIRRNTARVRAAAERNEKIIEERRRLRQEKIPVSFPDPGPLPPS